MDETVRAIETFRSWVADTPPGVVTWTGADPAEPAGITARIVDPLTTESSVALTAPNFTIVAPRNPVPVIVTNFPTVADAGETAEIVGTETPQPANGFAMSRTRPLPVSDTDHDSASALPVF